MDPKEDVTGKAGPKPPVGGIGDPVTEATLNKAIEGLQATILRFGKPMWTIITLVIIALLLGFITILMSAYSMVMDSNNFKTAAYQRTNADIDQLLKVLEPSVIRQK